MAARTLPLIPDVSECTVFPGYFSLEGRILFESDCDQAEAKVALLTSYIIDAGFPVEISRDPGTTGKCIQLMVLGDSVYDEQGFCDESYRIEIESETIHLTGATREGLTRAIQTFRQLTAPNIPCCRISDAPRFRWRGIHLDTARHFFSVDAVKQVIDLLALYRFNRFHWHLTDDQGWRVEILQYPRLMEIGSVRTCTQKGHYYDTPRLCDNTAYGGFYSQQEIREVVAFAAEREIIIVPEIDMPGHMQAAIAAYPELGCTGSPVNVRPYWGISQDILNVSDYTISFMQQVLTEVMELFPGKYIHIGGDEVPKYQWEHSDGVQRVMAAQGLHSELELQSWFITRMVRHIRRTGRKVIGWDEIVEGDIDPETAIMCWRGVEKGIEAARKGHAVVMTPWQYTYFDHYQSLPVDQEPLAQGGFLPTEKVYSFDPVDRMDPELREMVLGGQGQLWTEYIPDIEHLEYMLLPRACALAEVLWIPEYSGDYHGFLTRLSVHREKLMKEGISMHPKPF